VQPEALARREIFELIANTQEYHLDDGGREAVMAWFGVQPRGHGFGNGRSARNLFEASVARHAVRMVGFDDPTDEELMTLTAEDIGPPEVERRADDIDAPDLVE